MIFIFSCFFLLGAFKGCMDWQMKTNSGSWIDKYKQPLEPAPDSWYYKMYNLKYKERFFLSATLLVVLTDWWHFFSFAIMLVQLVLAVGALYIKPDEFLPVYYLIPILYSFRQLGFHLLYSWILPKT